MKIITNIINEVSKLKKSFGKLLRLEEIVRYELVRQQLEERCINEHNSIVDPEHGDIVVSLTTYSKRVNDVHLVIESIARQTVKPKRIILWLDEKEFSLKSIPLILRNMEDRGLEIKFCENLKSYKKLIPTLSCSKEINIVTIDDDIIYPYFFLEYLSAEAEIYPNTVIGFRGHLIKFNDEGIIKPYVEWGLDIDSSEPSYDIFPTGVGGIYYPSNCLDKRCGDYELAAELAPNGDDIWFKAMTLLTGAKCKIVSRNFDFNSDFIEIKSNQDIGLFQKNLHENGNDSQIKSVFSYFKLFEIMSKGKKV